jgi:hypothetical protein
MKRYPNWGAFFIYGENLSRNLYYIFPAVKILSYKSVLSCLLGNVGMLVQPLSI